MANLCVLLFLLPSNSKFDAINLWISSGTLAFGAKWSIIHGTRTRLKECRALWIPFISSNQLKMAFSSEPTPLLFVALFSVLISEIRAFISDDEDEKVRQKFGDFDVVADSAIKGAKNCPFPLAEQIFRAPMLFFHLVLLSNILGLVDDNGCIFSDCAIWQEAKISFIIDYLY